MPDIAMPDLKTLMERKMRLERRLAKAKLNVGKQLTVGQVAATEAELADVNTAIAADDEQFAERRQQREQLWRDTDPAHKGK